MQQNNIIVGIDEAGRGPWAGPVTACACFVSKELNQAFPEECAAINDSKKISEKKRELLFAFLKKHADYAVVSASAKKIDVLGIKKATQWAMRQAVQKLQKILDEKDCVIQLAEIDGNDRFDVGVESSDIIKGDEKVQNIAAASIIAKVTRDQYMCRMDKKYPEYGFAKHKGYGTKEHSITLKKQGICPLHRTSYKPIQEICQKHSSHLS